jgi:protein XagA
VRNRGPEKLHRQYRAVLGTLLMMCSFADRANAGAWTLPAGETQIITGVTFSTATAKFDSSGAVPAQFRKILAQSYGEHGLTDRLTLVLVPEYATATELDPDQPVVHASEFAVRGGLRYRITDSIGVLSAEASYKTSGGFDTPLPVVRHSGSEVELRLLYGVNFRLFHRGAYVDAEVGQRWISGARPDETAADVTFGLHWSEKFTIMAQSFNVVSAGHGEPPYTYFRSHKLQLAFVQRLWKGVSLETGAFVSPMGENALVERGAITALWVHF